MKKTCNYVANVAVNGGSSAYVTKFLHGNNKRILELWAKAFGREHLRQGKSIEWDVRETSSFRVVASGSFFSFSRRYVRYA